MQAPTIQHAGGEGHGVRGWGTALKLLGLLCCAVPLGLLLLFAVGEGLDEGWGHLLQAVPLVLLLLAAWWRPLAGGPLITLVGTGLAIVYALTGLDNAWWLPTMAMFVAPAVVGGLLFTAAGIVAHLTART